MNARTVLDKIIGMFNEAAEPVQMETYAKLADGTIVYSPSFDVDQPLEVVSEDGTKSPAPDGEHELVLKDSEGYESRFKVITKDGKIVERENVELPESDDAEEMKAETVKTKELPNTTMEDKANEVKELAEMDPLPSGDGVEEDAEPIPADTDMGAMVEKLQYRIEEMEKKMSIMEAAMKPVEETKKEADVKMEDDVKLPKLDGAPVENTNLSAVANTKTKNSVGNYQETFLNRLYNN